MDGKRNVLARVSDVDLHGQPTQPRCRIVHTLRSSHTYETPWHTTFGHLCRDFDRIVLLLMRIDIPCGSPSYAEKNTDMPTPATQSDDIRNTTILKKRCRASVVDRVSRVLFIVSVCGLLFAYGVGVGHYEVFPFGVINQAKRAFFAFTKQPYYYRTVNHVQKTTLRHLEGAYGGLNLITSVTAGKHLSAKIVDMDGKPINDWNIDWFDIWPDGADYVRGRDLPQTRPGTEIHGAVIMDNGDLVFNFSDLGLVRVNPAGEVVWKLRYQTHHSVSLDDDGNLWVGGLKVREQPVPEYPNYKPPFDEFTVVKVSGNGTILDEISVFDLLRHNHLQGLLYLGSLAKRGTEMHGDTLHLNDVECFPQRLAAGFFDHNDIMISLRNVNTVLVFRKDTHEVKYICSGMFVRQHDPDFVDGRTISVFDNNNVGSYKSGVQSRIVMIDAPTNKLTVAFEGNTTTPFYSDIMGKHQWLPNGNLLITEAMQGRAFEITAKGQVVWEYINYVASDRVGLVTEVTRLPGRYARLYANLATNRAVASLGVDGAAMRPSAKH